jgi:hypothetical protein
LTEEREEFNREREQFRRQCDGPKGDELRRWEEELREAFDGSELFTGVALRRSGDPEYHVRIYCSAAPEAMVEDLERELLSLWRERLRLEQEAHILERGAGSLVFDGVTAAALGETHISVRVRVEEVPLEEAAAADGTDPYLVALFGATDDGATEVGAGEEEESDGGLQPGSGGGDRGGDADLEHHG